MISKYFFLFILINLSQYSFALQSGYTCQTTVTLTCPSSRSLLIHEVTYSSECPNKNEDLNNTSIYAPSRCIGYRRELVAKQCNGKESCIIDHNLEQRPSFSIAKKEANCDFKGQSINIDYSCVPDFYSSKLPRIDICSLQSVAELKEGFIHTPNYPNNYPGDLECKKTIPTPESRHRLKIYALDFGIKTNARINDWLEIKNNGEKFYGAVEPYTLLFNDMIEAPLTFKSDASTTKQPYHGFLLYFIVIPIRRPRPPPTATTTDIPMIPDKDSSALEKPAALIMEKKREKNLGLIILVVLLSGILFILLCAFLLYKRRNDRRVRYITDTFNSFLSKKSKPITTHSSETNAERKLNTQVHFSAIPTDNKDHIYSADPLDSKYNEDELLYECIDDEKFNQQLKLNENNA